MQIYKILIFNLYKLNMTDWRFIQHLIWSYFFRCLPHPGNRVFPYMRSPNPRNY